MRSRPGRRAALALSALLVGCAGASRPDAPCALDPPWSGPPRVDVPDATWDESFAVPDEAPLDAALRTRLDAALDGLLEHYPGISAGIALPGEGTWARTRVRSGGATPADGAPLFQVASIGKAFTAVVVLQLVEEGRLGLGATVEPWWPDVPNASTITVDDLLRHTSGLVSFNALPAGRELGPGYHDPEALVAASAAEDPHFCPGAYWSYTNTGYVMLGRIVETVEGRPFEDVLRTRVLDPLGLADTVVRRPGVPEPRVVAGHASGRPLDGAPDYATPWTAGALASTGADLVRFWRALLGGELLPEAAVRAAFDDMASMQPLIPMPPGTTSFYGRGVQHVRAPGGDAGPGPMLGHDGGIAGFDATVAYLADDDAFVAVAVNDADVPAAAGLWTLVRALRAGRAR